MYRWMIGEWRKGIYIERRRGTWNFEARIETKRVYMNKMMNVSETRKICQVLANRWYIFFFLPQWISKCVSNMYPSLYTYICIAMFILCIVAHGIIQSTKNSIYERAAPPSYTWRVLEGIYLYITCHPERCKVALWLNFALIHWGVKRQAGWDSKVQQIFGTSNLLFWYFANLLFINLK